MSRILNTIHTCNYVQKLIIKLVLITVTSHMYSRLIEEEGGGIAPEVEGRINMVGSSS
jgi:hypothetical protein